jgi:hypothetical protein
MRHAPVKVTLRPARRWTEHDERLLAEFLPRLGVKAVAIGMHRSAEAVIQRAGDLGIKYARPVSAPASMIERDDPDEIERMKLEILRNRTPEQITRHGGLR